MEGFLGGCKSEIKPHSTATQVALPTETETLTTTPTPLPEFTRTPVELPTLMPTIQIETPAPLPTPMDNADPRNENVGISSVYERHVLSWQEKIHEWAFLYDLNPNLIAGLMRIESSGIQPEYNDGDQYVGLFAVEVSFFPKGMLHITDPDNNARAAFGYYTKEEGMVQDMRFWSFSGGLELAEQFTEKETSAATAELLFIINQSPPETIQGRGFRYWSLRDEYIYKNEEKFNTVLTTVTEALKENPDLIKVFYAYFGYHGGNHLIYPYDLTSEGRVPGSERVSLLNTPSTPDIGSSINYGIKGLYFYILATKE